jgi:IPT/TIG domain/FG-GAP repeat
MRYGIVGCVLAVMLGGLGFSGPARAPVGAHGSSAGLLALPVAAQGPVSAVLRSESREYAVHGRTAANPAQHLRLRFTDLGVVVLARRSLMRLALRRVGRADISSVLSATAAPTVAANRVTYVHGSIREWYVNGPLGLEQGFDLLRRPGGSGELRLGVALSGVSRVVPDRHGALLTLASGGSLCYCGLTAADSAGRSLPARLAVGHGVVSIVIDDRLARYPVRVDPFVQQGSKLHPGDESGNGEFGTAVALSSDGNTALVGAPDDDSTGAAFVFVRSNGVWAEQAKLVGSGVVGSDSGEGGAVALSSDGNTALIGAAGDNASVGAAWVFTRSGTAWSQQGGKIVPGDEAGSNVQFGYSVALSSTGNTAIIGGRGDNNAAGAAWAYVRSNGTWSEQQKLTSSGSSDLGASAGLSSDGNTALVGEPGEPAGVQSGAVVFVRSGATWSQQGGKLIGSGGAGTVGESQGHAVTLSSDGNTALIGGAADNNFVGATWVFVRSNGTWSQQGVKLVGSQSGVTSSQQGYSVALTGDGNTALIGEINGTGGAWVFTRSSGTWSQQGGLVQGSGSSGTSTAQGWSVALSSDGTTAMMGGPHDTSQSGGLVGAAWAFGDAPAVSSVSPNSGPASGGTAVTITGTGVTGASAVKFGSTAATSFTVNSATRITATSPAGSAGAVDVTVATAGGTSATGSADEFTYVAVPTVTAVSPSAGPLSGGTSVTISGTNFAGATAVEFGSTAATSYATDSSTQITATSPAGSAGSVDVTVTTVGGTSLAGSADQFAYVAPVVTGVGPSVGPSSPAPSPPRLGAAPSAPLVLASRPTVTGSSGAAFAGIVNPGGSATTAYFEYGLDSKYTGGGAVDYDLVAPLSSLGAGSVGVAVSRSVSGLVPDALYHVRLVATNSAGTTTGPDQTFTTDRLPDPPAPVLGKTTNATPVAGLVLVKFPAGYQPHAAGVVKGQGFIPLTQARQIPVGSQIDALRGTLMLTAAGRKRHSTQHVRLTGGVFSLAQTGSGPLKGLTTFALQENAFTGAPSYASCTQSAKLSHAARADGAPDAVVAKLKPKVLQTLLASEKSGSFRTRGRYSAATVRGTEWETEDRCDGTLTVVKRGIVSVLDFHTRKTITVTAGHSFLARAAIAGTR